MDHDNISQVRCVSPAAEGVGLVAVGNSNGLIVIFDLTKHLMLWETWSFHVDEDRIAHGLTLTSQQHDSSGQVEKLKQKVDQPKHPPAAEEVNERQQQDKEQENQQEEKQVEEDKMEEEKEVQKQEEDKQVEKDKTEEGKEAEKQETELLQQEDKASHEKQEGHQEHKTAKEDDDKAATVPITSQQGLSVSSCKLHSLGIVQLTKQQDPEGTSVLPNSSKKDADSSNADPSLLIGVSFDRNSGTQDAAIIVFNIHSTPTRKSIATTTKKSKSKYTSIPTLSSAGISIELMSDALLDMDDVMPSSLPITVDIDTPSWELVPPLPPEPPLISSTIPPPPPLPPLKNSNSANKTEKGTQLQMFVVSEYIDDLPNDAHPVVSVIQPCGHSRVAVALEYGPNYGGCIILFNLEHCTGKTILGKSVMFDLKTSDEQVIDMCVMENLHTRTNNSHFLATINKRGSFVVFSMDMNIVISKSFTDDPLVSCFPCVNVGLFGLVTRSGIVKTIKVVSGKPVAEVDVLAATVVDSGAVGDDTIPINPHKG